MSKHEGVFDCLKIAEIVSQQSDWKDALDSVIAVVRSVFIFDNLALFIAEEKSTLTEIVYARAVGRGQSAGADTAWGVDVANQVMERNEIVLQRPSENHDDGGNRLTSAYLLGLPLRTSSGVLGAAVFVRFGGPDYTAEHIHCGRYIATQFSGLFERKRLNEDIYALEDARRLLALQEDFIATISHELRTPLGFIKGYSTTLLRTDTEWDEATRHEFLTIIDEEADHLTSLIENVLESARLQSNTMPMKFQPVRLDTLIRDTAIRAQARFKEMRVKFDFTDQPVVMADNVRLSQVFGNLFSNAAKYAPGAAISISLARVKGFYRIRFSDNGPGIAPEHLAHLFKRFFRVPGQSGSGSGLGLFICEKIIEAHNGKISVKSKIGKGTIFSIDLPIESAIRTEGGQGVK